MLEKDQICSYAMYPNVVESAKYIRFPAVLVIIFKGAQNMFQLRHCNYCTRCLYIRKDVYGRLCLVSEMSLLQSMKNC